MEFDAKQPETHSILRSILETLESMNDTLKDIASILQNIDSRTEEHIPTEEEQEGQGLLRMNSATKGKPPEDS